MMPHPLPLSPDAAALGKYGDYPVNLYTGLPDISIPLYEVKSGSLSMPITLSYHASGFRVSDVSGWCGLGWTIITGGQISREVRNKSDEEYYYNNPIQTSLSACNDYYYIKDIAQIVRDTEPDLFSYSYPGKSGKFMLGQAPPGNTHVPYLIPYEPIKIKENFNVNKFDKFEITDEQGILYRFGKTTTGRVYTEYSSGSYGGVVTNTTTSWPLTEVIAPNSNDRIDISYQLVGVITRSDQTHSLTIKDNCQTLDPGGSSCPFPPVDGVRIVTNTIETNQRGINQINFEQGRIDFLLGPSRQDQSSSKTLDEIRIYKKLNNNYTLIKSIKFLYGYFQAESDGKVIQSANLKLTGIQIRDKSSVAVQNYNFDYFTDSFYRQAGPYARDYWDFYNNRSNGSLIPRMTIPYQANDGSYDPHYVVGDADRSTNPEFMKDGVLRKITYPTGGYTMFDYETHQYLDDSNSPQYAGGLRLKSIESNGGGDSPPTVKTYKYGVDESGYGVPNFSMSKSFYQVESQIRQIRTFQPPITRTTFRIRTIISNSALSMDAYDGSTVVYPYVTEYHGTPESNIGKVVYQYDNGGYQPDGYRVVPLSSKVFKDTYFWARGKLTLKSVYDANANLTKTTQLAYFGSHYENRTIGHGAFQYVYYTLDRVGFLNQCTTPSNELVDAMEYQNAPFSQSTGSTREAIVTETTYDAGNANKSVVSITSKAYHPDYLQVTEMKSSKSNNFEEYVQKIKYPFSYANNPNATGNPIGSYSALNTLLQSNILSQPVEELSLVRKTDGSNERVTAGKYSTFKINPSNASQIVPDQIFLLETNAAIPSAAFKETNLNNVMLVDERYKARITFGEYDSDGNLLDVSKSDDNHLVYIWGYNNAIPIAEVVNASRKNVFHTSFEEDNTGIVSNDAKTGVKSKQAGYTLNLSNLDPGNYVLTYYQKNNGVWEQQLVNITVGNAGTYNTTFNTQIDEVRFYPVNAMMTTYTHEPLVGITSVTDVNGMTTYYVYDDFMRLILIRDNDANIVKSFNYNYFKP